MTDSQHDSQNVPSDFNCVRCYSHAHGTARRNNGPQERRCRRRITSGSIRRPSDPANKDSTQDTYVQQTDTHRPHDDLRARDGGARGRTTRVHHAGARVAAQHAMAARKTPARAPSRIAAAPCAALSTAPTRPHARIRQRRSPRRCRTPSRAPQQNDPGAPGIVLPHPRREPQAAFARDPPTPPRLRPAKNRHLGRCAPSGGARALRAESSLSMPASVSGKRMPSAVDGLGKVRAHGRRTDRGIEAGPAMRDERSVAHRSRAGLGVRAPVHVHRGLRPRNVLKVRRRDDALEPNRVWLVEQRACVIREHREHRSEQEFFPLFTTDEGTTRVRTGVRSGQHGTPYRDPTTRDTVRYRA